MLDVNAAALTQVGAADAGSHAAAPVHPDQAAARPGIGALSLAQNFDDSAMPAFAMALTALAQGAHFFAIESSFQRLDGAARQNELTLLVMPGHEQSLDFVIVSTVDITERKRMDADLLALATTDFLTGLPNRREFMARLDDQQARLQRGVDSAAVLMLDLDHFKIINDDHGHAAGDVVLRHVAALMRGCQRKIDTLGRVGGEEFAVLLPGADMTAASLFAERLRHCVADTPLLLEDGSRLAVTVSIGIALMSETDRGYDAALIRADQALYCAKRAGRNRVEPECGARPGGGRDAPPV
jgi:diguanylate cyclase (GGDEF)-like protein